MSKRPKLISVGDRTKKFSEDMYANGGGLLCKFHQHSIEHFCGHIIKMHIKYLSHTKVIKRKKTINNSSALKMVEEAVPFYRNMRCNYRA